MQINVTLPLRWAQCWGYAIILMLVNLIVIFPLSAFLFQDFYSRMIPADSVQTIPFSESRKEMGNRSGNIKTTFQFDVERYSSDTAILPHVAANGFAQNVPLRADIPYNVNLDLNVFCLNKVTDLSVRDAEITISVSTSKKLAESVVFRKTLIFSCANTRDIPSLCENNRLSSTFANQVQKELVNSFHLDNPIFIEHDMKSLELSLKFAGNANLIVDPNTSLLTFSMNF
ncbi:LANO_0G11958g1_1 [Lachancea nothofagi CBS 11611]|uniref:LANO_0G11958g1_1 n=1 Tax=Lachancea nothofagi CBS 11611 TaxID=1266666 RepID=A0A1G4KJR4_9SACH|nr:LANO_0G11958g1_1 [Lachancea nothofagi CBS 11611]